MSMPSTPQMVLPTLPQAPASPAAFAPISPPSGTKVGRKSPTASFLGASALPSQASAGWKTLLGQ